MIKITILKIFCNGQRNETILRLFLLSKRAYKSVSLNIEAYELLKKIKKENESFSDVIIRLIKQPDIKEILNYFGSMEDDLPDDTLKEFIKEAKQAWN